MVSSRSLWHISENESLIKEAKLPEIPEGYVLVKSLFSLISTGTERLVASGMVPADLYRAMNVPYMEGSFNFSVKYGYSLVGEVVSKGHPLTGHLVHAMHPHQDFCMIKETDLFPVPEEISPQRATLAANLETAVNAIWDARVSIGDRVLVLGFGMIGSLVARLLSLMPAVEVHVLENNPIRIESAARMGFKTITKEVIKDNHDLAFHTSSTSEGLQTCIDSVGKEGKVIELSWYGNKAVNIKLGSGFHIDRKQVISSQVSNIPAVKGARWNFQRRKNLIFELLRNPNFDQHISHVIGFEDTPSFFRKLRNQLPEGIGYAISYK